MAIVVVLIGSFLIIGFGNPEKAAIEDTLDELESLVLRTKAHSHSKQVDCLIQLEKKHLVVTRELDSTKLISQVEVPKKYKLQFRSKPKIDWQPVDQNPLSIFIGKSGLNTPAGILLKSQNSSGELQFDPLTGKAQRQIEIDD